MLNFKVPNNCENNLLNILNVEGVNLPNDVRTLMKTPKSMGTILHASQQRRPISSCRNIVATRM